MEKSWEFYTLYYLSQKILHIGEEGSTDQI